MWDPKIKSRADLVDYGIAKPRDEENQATEALVFIIPGISGHWKHPITYFLQDMYSVTVQALPIKYFIGLLHDEGLNVTALVLDSIYSNQSTAKLLACKMNVLQKQTWFAHPQRHDPKVHVIFYVCHLAKLMRNLLIDHKIICHEVKVTLHQIC